MKLHENTSERGFTLVEMMIVLVLLIPLLVAIGATTTTVTDTVDTTNRSSMATHDLRRTSRRIANFVRPAKLSTFKVTAIQADVAALRAVSVGEWIDPTDLLWRPGIEFQAASGLLSMNAALSTMPRRLTFSIDSNEMANGKDDDGDGLIDEGSIRLLHNSTTVAMVRNIEECSFALDGRLLLIRLASGRRDSRGRVHRAVLEQRFYMRNN